MSIHLTFSAFNLNMIIDFFNHILLKLSLSRSFRLVYVNRPFNLPVGNTPVVLLSDSTVWIILRAQ